MISVQRFQPPLIQGLLSPISQIASRCHGKAIELRQGYASKSEADKASLWANLATLGAIVCVGVSLAPGVKKEVRVVSAPVALAVLTVSEKATKTSVKARQLRRLEKVEKFERDKEHLVATYRPWDAKRLNPLGGKLQAIVNVLNIDPGSIDVDGMGVESAGTYDRYNLNVKYLRNGADLFGMREKVGSAVMSSESITFNWVKGALAIDVSKPKNACVYPTVKEYLGNDRQQIIIPMGMALDRMVSLQVDDNFNGFAIVGEPGSGKTIGAKGMIQFLGCRHHPSVIQYWMSEPQMSKASSFPAWEFEGDPHLFAANSYSYATTLQVMAKMIYECRRRTKIFEDAGVASLDAYNRVAEKPLPRIFGFVDECENFFDKELCDPVYRFPFMRMCLVIARMTRSQGGHLILLPKSMAAGSQTEDSADMFPIPLRRTFGGGICLKVANITDAEIALQGDREDEYLVKSVPHLPKNGAAVCRENGALVRIQMLYADKPTTEMPIVGRGVVSLPNHELPDLLEVLEEFSAPKIAEDDELAKILASEGLNYGDMIAMMTGKTTLKELRTGDKKVKAQAANLNEVSDQELHHTYQQYRQLRETALESKGGKLMSMSEAVSAVANVENRGSKAWLDAQRLIDKACVRFLPDWLEDLPQHWTSEQCAKHIFGSRTKPTGKEQVAYFVSQVVKARAFLTQELAARN